MNDSAFVRRMTDERLRRREREEAASDEPSVRLRFRNDLRRAGRGSAGLRPDLDLGIRHVWAVEGLAGNLTFGACRDLLASLCSQEDAIHPFIGSIARPLTFKETVQARIDQFKEFQKQKKSVKTGQTLWTSWLDTCTAIVYKKSSTKFKIIPLSPNLLRLPASFKNAFLADIDYDSFTDVDEIDMTNPEHGVYNELLTQEQVVGNDKDLKPHRGWLAALGGDNAENRALLKEYAAIVFALLKRDTAMQFWTVHDNPGNQQAPILPRENQLWALYADNVGGGCGCVGFRVLINVTRLARVRPL